MIRIIFRIIRHMLAPSTIHSVGTDILTRRWHRSVIGACGACYCSILCNLWEQEECNAEALSLKERSLKWLQAPLESRWGPQAFDLHCSSTGQNEEFLK